MPDGRIVFSTEIDNKKLAKDLAKSKREIERVNQEIERHRQAKSPLVEQANELGVALDAAKAKLAALKTMQSKIARDMESGSPGDYINAYSQKSAVDADITTQEKTVKRLQKQWNGINDRADRYNTKIQAAEKRLMESQARAGALQQKLSSGGAKFASAIDSAKASMAKIGRTISGTMKSVVLFSVMFSVFQKVSEYMQRILNSNAEYRMQLAQLKGALLTAFQPIWEIVYPALMAVMRVLTAITQAVGRVLSILFGKSYGDMQKNAKAMHQQAAGIGEIGNAAKEAAKDLMAFDEINRLSDPQEATGSGGISGGGQLPVSPDFTAPIKEEVDALGIYLSGALLAIGAILAFSGINIPLGIALMAAGAVGLAAIVAENWGALDGPVGKALTRVSLLIGGMALAIGTILAMTGHLPLGIALMAVGAVGLASAAALNWNAIQEALQGPIGAVTAMASAALLVLGIILCCTGVALPLGIALLATGAAGLVTVAAVNWNAITDKVKEVWGNIKNFWYEHCAKVFTVAWWQDKFRSIGEGLVSSLKSGINAGIGLVNRFTGWLSSILSFSIPPMAIGGKQIFGGFSTNVSIPQIPYLAQGAVLPANKPFLAMVGDQRNGTNVEAPLETIKQALAEVLSEMGLGDIDINFTGDLAQLARILEPVITRKQRQQRRALGV